MNKNELNKDIEICKDVKTGEPVVIPFEDRFVNTLILGPTGSGKTSKVLIPMIEQDIANGQGVTVIEPKGDLAEKVYDIANRHDREVIYFNPMRSDCPHFNPLYGAEENVIENMIIAFKMLNPDLPQFFQDMNETLISNSLKVLKRLKGNEVNLIDLSTLITNAQGEGKRIIIRFSKLSAKTIEEAKENIEIASWYLSNYFNEKHKTYEHCSGLRSQVSKVLSSSNLRGVLNPSEDENSLNFENILSEGKVLVVSTAQGELRDIGRFLGYLIVLNFQSAVFRRPGTEDARTPHFLYIDEFQNYSNSGFANILTQGRSYRVASYLAFQNRALMSMGGGKNSDIFVELVSANARNVILFPGGNSSDAKYYSQEFESGDKDNLASYDIVYRNANEITYRIIKGNTMQEAAIGQI